MRTVPWEAVCDSKLSDSLRLYDMQPGTQRYEIPEHPECDIRGKWPHVNCKIELKTQILKCIISKLSRISKVKKNNLFSGLFQICHVSILIPVPQDLL